jgi:Sulfotransferase domain
MDLASSGPADTGVGTTDLVTADPVGLPSFFIIGPPRTGTSWLYEVLRQQITLPSPLKETRFFDEHFHRGLKWYQGHYQHVSAKRRVGEIAPTYFASTAASERIAQIIPQAKIVCVFRNPVERVLSLYRLKRAYGLIPWTFELAIARDPELMESSKYASNLKAWQHAIGKDNVLATIYDDLRDGPQSYIDRLADFIDIPRFALTDEQLRRVHDSDSLTLPRSYYRTRSATLVADWFKARRLGRIVAAFHRSPLRKLVLGGGRPFAKVSHDTAARLYDTFRPEVEQLERMLNRDLSAWKSRRTA